METKEEFKAKVLSGEYADGRMMLLSEVLTVLKKIEENTRA